MLDDNAHGLTCTTNLHSDMVSGNGLLQAAAEEGSGKVSTTASRRPLLNESNVATQKPVTSETKRVPSYMKSTHTSNTRSSIGSASDTDARFAF